MPPQQSQADAAVTDTDRAHMRRAIDLSRKAGLEARTGKCFGAVVVDASGRVVGEGYNQVFAENDPTFHAEVAAIRAACKAIGSPSLAGCTVYSSTMPCPMCTGAIYWAKVARCFYGADNEDVIKHGVFETGGDYTKDVFFDREDRLPAGERTKLPFVQLLREEAAAVHEDYGKLPAEQRAVY